MRPSTASTIVILALLSAVPTGCIDIGEELMMPVDRGNFVLYVTNQSPTIRSVDVRVYIDGRRAVQQEFTYGFAHNFVRFEFNVSEGKHTLLMASSRVRDEQTMDFVLLSTPYAVVTFWSATTLSYADGGDPPHFTVDLLATQPLWQ
jgi:hypothetical protein